MIVISAAGLGLTRILRMGINVDTSVAVGMGLMLITSVCCSYVVGVVINACRYGVNMVWMELIWLLVWG